MRKRIGSEQQTDSDGILPNKEKCACPEAQGTGTSLGKVTHRKGKERTEMQGRTHQILSLMMSDESGGPLGRAGP